MASTGEQDPTSGDHGEPDALVEASVVGLGMVIRSLAPALERVTLQQYRILVLLVTDGPMRAGDLAQELGLLPSGITRMVDRLVRDGFVERHPLGREVQVAAAPPATALVTEVLESRRTAFRTVLRAMDAEERTAVRRAATALARRAGPDPSIDARLLLAAAPDGAEGAATDGRRGAPPARS